MRACICDVYVCVRVWCACVCVVFLQQRNLSPTCWNMSVCVKLTSPTFTNYCACSSSYSCVCMCVHVCACQRQSEKLSVCSLSVTGGCQHIHTFSFTQCVFLLYVAVFDFLFWAVQVCYRRVYREVGQPGWGRQRGDTRRIPLILWNLCIDLRICLSLAAQRADQKQKTHFGLWPKFLSL